MNAGDKPVVTQRARDAAADMNDAWKGVAGDSRDIRRGDLDDWHVVQAFARFEQGTLSREGREACGISCPDWHAWERDLKQAATRNADPISDEELNRFRHALADVHCKSSSRERSEVEYRLQRFGARMWRRILSRLDAAESALSTAPASPEQADQADVLLKVLATLVAKIDLCAPHVSDAFLHRQMRVGEYKGPTIEAELNAARAALKAQEG